MKRDDLKMVAHAVAAGIDYGVAAHTVIKDPDALERAISGDANTLVDITEDYEWDLEDSFENEEFYEGIDEDLDEYESPEDLSISEEQMLLTIATRLQIGIRTSDEEIEEMIDNLPHSGMFRDNYF